MVNRVSDHRRQQAEDRVQASHSALRFVVFHDRCILADFRFVCNGGLKDFFPSLFDFLNHSERMLREQASCRKEFHAGFWC